MGVVAAEPTDQEVEEWAEREKKRREAWLAGPSEAEKREWSRRQRDLSELRELHGASDEPHSELERDLERRLRRDVHLARAGILGLFLNLPYSAGAKLIRSGVDAQYDYYTEPASRRRMPPDFTSGGD
jgi:ferric-dicitrate binding protein FerR (iron transport regulator)